MRVVHGPHGPRTEHGRLAMELLLRIRASCMGRMGLAPNTRNIPWSIFDNRPWRRPAEVGVLCFV